MRILTRYVLREFVIPLFYCLAGFVSIYVLFDLFGSFSRIVESDLSFGEIALYFCGYLLKIAFARTGASFLYRNDIIGAVI